MGKLISIPQDIYQDDGISVKERIIQFFMTNPRVTREDAIELYSISEDYGEKLGQDAFDNSIFITCKAIDLDPFKLSEEIHSHSHFNMN